MLIGKLVRIDVAPFTGAWIEMFSIDSNLPSLTPVAPFTGAWIEIAAPRLS